MSTSFVGRSESGGRACGYADSLEEAQWKVLDTLSSHKSGTLYCSWRDGDGNHFKHKMSQHEEVSKDSHYYKVGYYYGKWEDDRTLFHCAKGPTASSAVFGKSFYAATTSEAENVALDHYGLPDTEDVYIQWRDASGSNHSRKISTVMSEETPDNRTRVVTYEYGTWEDH